MHQIKKKPKSFYFLMIYILLTIILSFLENKALTGGMVKIGGIFFVIVWIQMFFYVKNANKVASRFYKIKLRDIFKKKESD